MSIKIGVIGCSSIAKRMVIPAIKKSDKFILSGIASRDKEKANLWSEQYETTAFSYSELLNSDVDAIYVSVPVGLHYKWGKQVLQHNKHLLMEKTFTTTHAQGKDLFSLSEVKSLACMEALMYQYHPVQKQIDLCIKNIGAIKHLEAHFGFPHFRDKSDIRYSKHLGGGASLDCLIYPLSFVFRTLGTNYTDYKASVYYDKEYGVDERGYIHIEYPQTAASISYGFGHSYRNEITVWGESAIMRTKRVFTRPKKCSAPIQIWSDKECFDVEPEQSDHFLDMLSAFSDNIKTLNNNSEDTLTRIRFIEEILNSKGERL